MSIKLAIGGIVLFSIFVFLGGMLLFPEIFGISKKTDGPEDDEEVEK